MAACSGESLLIFPHLQTPLTTWESRARLLGHGGYRYFTMTVIKPDKAKELHN